MTYPNKPPVLSFTDGDWQYQGQSTPPISSSAFPPSPIAALHIYERPLRRREIIVLVVLPLISVHVSYFHSTALVPNSLRPVLGTVSLSPVLCSAVLMSSGLTVISSRFAENKIVSSKHFLDFNLSLLLSKAAILIYDDAFNFASVSKCVIFR